MGSSSTPFLTLEDPNAKIKGSRDPLGLQPIWSRFGRHVVTNLTTVTTSVRGFTILLLGRYFGERLIEDGIVGREEALNVFLRMEQLGAYARHAGHEVDDDIRGVERVKRFLEEGRGRVFIQADSRGAILADQKVYGLWGLFSVSARTSGLLKDGPVGLTDAARQFIEATYVPRLQEVMTRLRRILAEGGWLDARKKDPVFKALASTLPPRLSAGEIEFYRAYLRDGLHVKTDHPGRQERLSYLMRSETNLDEVIGCETVVRLAETAQADDPGLSLALNRIAKLEATLAPAEVLFDHLLTQHGQRPSSVDARLREVWGSSLPHLDSDAFDDLLPEVRDASSIELVSSLRRCHRALARGNYGESMDAVLEWNRVVMAFRKAAPWVLVGPDGRLDVRYRGAEQLLPERDELILLWRNPYFLDSLRQITWKLEDDQ